MGVKETIAFIGGTGKTCPVLMKKLAQEELRLLFVSNDQEQLEELSKQWETEGTSSEIELIHCAKEGCWEADIIAFVDPGNIQEQQVEKIKEVATQKIVLCILTGKPGETTTPSTARKEDLKQWLPHSKIVWAIINSEEMQAEIYGNNIEALDLISALLEKPGYSTKKLINKK